MRDGPYQPRCPTPPSGFRSREPARYPARWRARFRRTRGWVRVRRRPDSAHQPSAWDFQTPADGTPPKHQNGVPEPHEGCSVQVARVAAVQQESLWRFRSGSQCRPAAIIACSQRQVIVIFTRPALIDRIARNGRRIKVLQHYRSTMSTNKIVTACACHSSYHQQD